MNLSAIAQVVGLIAVAAGGTAYVHTNFEGKQDAETTQQALKSEVKEKLETAEKSLELKIAQSAQVIQQDVNAIRIQQMQWELNDINDRIAKGQTLPGDLARKLVLEARLKKLAGQ